MSRNQQQPSSTGHAREPRLSHFDDEGFGFDQASADRSRTSQAHGRHAANAVVAATSANQQDRGQGEQ